MEVVPEIDPIIQRLQSILREARCLRVQVEFNLEQLRATLAKTQGHQGGLPHRSAWLSGEVDQLGE
jgi:hypothetical protein